MSDPAITLVTSGEYSDYRVAFATTATREQIDAAVKEAFDAGKSHWECREFLMERLPVIPWTEAYLGDYTTPTHADFTTHDGGTA